MAKKSIMMTIVNVNQTETRRLTQLLCHLEVVECACHVGEVSAVSFNDYNNNIDRFRTVFDCETWRLLPTWVHYKYIVQNVWRRKSEVSTPGDGTTKSDISRKFSGKNKKGWILRPLSSAGGWMLSAVLWIIVVWRGYNSYMRAKLIPIRYMWTNSLNVV